MTTVPTDCPTLTSAKLGELAELAARNPGVLITVETEVLLALLWAAADSVGASLQTIVDNWEKTA